MFGTGLYETDQLQPTVKTSLRAGDMMTTRQIGDLRTTVGFTRMGTPLKFASHSGSEGDTKMELIVLPIDAVRLIEAISNLSAKIVREVGDQVFYELEESQTMRSVTTLTLS